MDSRSYWFGVAIALAVLLFWKHRGISSGLYLASGATLPGAVAPRNGVPATGAATSTTPCGCGASSVVAKFINTITPPPFTGNSSAPASARYLSTTRNTAPARAAQSIYPAINTSFPVY